MQSIAAGLNREMYNEKIQQQQQRQAHTLATPPAVATGATGEEEPQRRSPRESSTPVPLPLLLLPHGKNAVGVGVSAVVPSGSRLRTTQSTRGSAAKTAATDQTRTEPTGVDEAARISDESASEPASEPSRPESRTEKHAPAPGKPAGTTPTAASAESAATGTTPSATAPSVSNSQRALERLLRSDTNEMSIADIDNIQT